MATDFLKRIERIYIEELEEIRRGAIREGCFRIENTTGTVSTSSLKMISVLPGRAKTCVMSSSITWITPFSAWPRKRSS